MKQVLTVLVCSAITGVYVHFFGVEMVQVGLLVSIMCILIDKKQGGKQ